MTSSHLKKNTLSGLMWKFFENFGTQLINFIIQLVLARLLLPEDYGTIAITAVFILIAQVFIQTGFSAAIIQKKTLSDLEINSVFHAGWIIAVVIYITVFLASPFVGSFYQDTLLVNVLRVQAFLIVITAFSSVQNALLIRNFEFKKSFVYRFIAVMMQGALGIMLALNGFGVWAIVYSNILNASIITLCFWFIVKWKPKKEFSWTAFKGLFSYSYRVFMTTLINTLFNNLQSLIIGKQYSKESLGYYNRGYQIPMLIMVNTDGAINSVMFSSLSKVQDNQSQLLSMYRRSIRSSVFIIFPMMIGLIAIAEPLTLFLLTDKWKDSVPFLQLVSIICMTWPFSMLYQLLNAQNRERLSFWINFLSKIVAVIAMVIAMNYSIYLFVLSALVGQLVSVGIGFVVAKRIYNYRIIDQIYDAMLSLIPALVMGSLVFSMNYLIDSLFIRLVIQGLTGVISYVIISYLLNRETMLYLIKSVHDLFNKESM